MARKVKKSPAKIAGPDARLIERGAAHAELAAALTGGDEFYNSDEAEGPEVPLAAKLDRIATEMIGIRADTLAGVQVKMEAASYYIRAGIEEHLSNGLLGSLLWDLGRLSCAMKTSEEVIARRAMLRVATTSNCCTSLLRPRDRWSKNATAAIQKLRPFVSLGGTAH